MRRVLMSIVLFVAMIICLLMIKLLNPPWYLTIILIILMVALFVGLFYMMAKMIGGNEKIAPPAVGDSSLNKI